MNFSVRHIAAAYLLLLTLLKLAAVPFACIDYVLHKDQIAANFCVNKARPAVHCHGKCHLEKQLANSSESGDAQAQKGGRSFSVDFFSGFEVIALTPLSTTAVPQYGPTAVPALSQFSKLVFHPPLA